MSDSNRDLAAVRQRHADALARDLEEARARARRSELELAKKEAAVGQHGREVRDKAKEERRNVPPDASPVRGLGKALGMSMYVEG